jgi:hypothetical protein
MEMEMEMYAIGNEERIADTRKVAVGFEEPSDTQPMHRFTWPHL